MTETFTDSPSTAPTTKQKRGFPLSRVLVLTSAFIAILAIIAKFYYSFLIFDETYFARVFYSWRAGYANKPMYADTWKFIAKNKYDKEKTPELYRLIEYAQLNRNLFDGHPEHYPRQQNGYFSHGGDHEFNLMLNKWRKGVNQIDEKLTEDIFEGKQLLTDKMMQWWLGTNEANTESAATIYAKTDLNMQKFMWELATFLNKIYGDYYKSKDAYVGAEVSDIILKDIKKLLDKAGFILREKATKDQKPEEAAALSDEAALAYIKQIVIDFGYARARSGPCFVFSRAMNAIVFTLVKKDLPIYEGLSKIVATETDEKKKKKAEEKLEKMRKSGAYRLERISQCITFLLTKLCKFDYEEPMKNKSKFLQSIEKAFGAKYVAYQDDSEPLKAIMEGMNETIGFTWDPQNPEPEFQSQRITNEVGGAQQGSGGEIPLTSSKD